MGHMLRAYRIGQGGRIDRIWADSDRFPEGWVDTPDKLVGAAPEPEPVPYKPPTTTGEVYGERRRGGWPKGVSRKAMAER